jgi:protein phosphatase
MTIEVGAATVKGRVRRQNEDRYAVLLPPDLAAEIDLVVVVADGIGGVRAGHIASTMVVDHVAGAVSRRGVVGASGLDRNYDDLLKRIIRGAHREVRVAAGDGRRRGMGSTVTVAILTNDRLYLGHIGDSRAYVVYGDTILQFSRDHSWVADLVQAGQLTATEALVHPSRHYISRYVGGPSDLQVDTTDVAMSAGDRLLVCTDGLTKVVTDAELLEMVKSCEHPRVAAEKLVALAHERGGDDDATVVVAHAVSSSADVSIPWFVEEKYETRPLDRGRVLATAFVGVAILSLLTLWSAASDQSLWSIAENAIRLISR